MFRDFLSMLFPASCVSCGENITDSEKLICTSCRAALPLTDHHLYKENDFKAKFYGKLPVLQAFAYSKFIKSGIVQELLHHLKYKGVEEISSLIGNWHAAQIAKSPYLEKPDVMLYVPLYKSKLKRRGYNQVNGYATAFAQKLEVPLLHKVLVRNANSNTQTKKGRYDRWKNVNAIFEVKNPEPIQDKHVLLADDVVTTGATLEACGNKLLEAGANSVSFVAMATA